MKIGEKSGVSHKHRVIACSVAIFYMMTLFPYSAYALEGEGAKRNRALVEAAFTGEKASAVISAERGGEVRLGRATIVIPPGALKKDTEISITRLFRVADTGERLYNATEGRGGYRFLPAGQQFEKEVIIRLPYGEELSGKKAALDELKTYFYDTKKGVWTALTRRVLLEDEGLIESVSTHFTDMINGTLVLPETAEALDFNINSIKNLEAANPLSGVVRPEGFEASSFGDASFRFSLPLTAGRAGLTPSVAVVYSSGGGNGICGIGFDVQYGSVITTDTRQGLPKYDGNDTYVKDGTILEKVGGRGADRGRGDIRYRPEREAAFERIIRHHEKNGNTADDWWEVTDRQGRVRRYGRYGDGGVDGKVACVTEATRGIFTWYLTEEEDSYGNTVRYVYKKHGNYVYPDEIRYTGYYKGSHYTEGKHIVKFGYHETENTLRPDVRTDGRGKFITECALRLAWIQTYYGAITEGSLIRSYQFTYETGLGGVSLVSAFRVAYRNGESYEYRFTYEDLPKGEGNTYTVCRADTMGNR